MTAPHLLRREGPRQGECCGGAAAEADCGGNFTLLDQCDVFDQESEHALALTLWRVGIAPHGGKICSERENALTFLLVDNKPVGDAPTLIVFLSIRESAQLEIPVGLQRVGHETIGRIDTHITSSSSG